MTTALHSLPRRHGRKTRRVGRGHGSGRGTYSARGIKGQRARTGGKKGITQRALKQVVAHLPKQRGFRGRQLPFFAVNLDVLERGFTAGETVTPERLHAFGFQPTGFRGVKILGNGILTKKLTVRAHAFSATAERAITKAGGAVIRLRSSAPYGK